MPRNLDLDRLLDDARAHAGAREWESVREMLALAPRESAAGRGDWLLLAAEAELRLGAPRAARDLLLEHAAELERGGDGAAVRRASNLLGAAAFELGDLQQAHSAFSRALELADADGDHLLVARATNNLGAIANLRGDRDGALAHYQLAIPAYQHMGNAAGLAESFHNIAITYRDASELDPADEYERRALELARECESTRVRAMAQAGRAELCLLRGDARLADVGARLAAMDYESMADAVGEADALRLAGEARTQLGALDDALRVLNRAVKLAHSHESALIEGEALRARAEVFRLRGASLAAIEDANAARTLFSRLGAAADVARTDELLKLLQNVTEEEG
jgi:tetratricopeptide (TPR) repeat protein